MITKDLGAVSAYAYAVEQGYTGTEAEYAELMASYASVAQQASQSAQTAQTAQQTASTKASEAQQSATTANMAANGALLGLSTVQDVIGVLTWAEQNAEYQLTADTEIIPGKVYWTRSGSGTSADPYVYTPVAVPVAADLGSYYEITSVDEAMAEYINSHLRTDQISG